MVEPLQTSSDLVEDSSCSTVFSLTPDLGKFIPGCGASSSARQKELVAVQQNAVKVQPTSTKTLGRRAWDKRYFCYYCQLAVCRLPRHLYTAHSDEIEVAEIMATKDKDKKMSLITKVRNLGNELHNREVLSNASGSLAVVYRPSHERETSDSAYIPCQYCHGYFGRGQLWRHVRKCKCRPEHSKSTLRPVTAGNLLLPCTSNPGVSEVINGMTRGIEQTVVKHDLVLQKLAANLLSRVGHSKHHLNYIRSRLRKLARMLVLVRHTNQDLQEASLETVIAPEHFRAVLEAVKTMAGYNSKDHSFTAPSVAINIGHDLEKCAAMLQSIAVEQQNPMLEKRAQSFSHLYASEWNDEISGTARRVLQTRKMNKPMLLPVAEDVKKFTTHLKDIQNNSLLTINAGNSSELRVY